MIGRMNHPQIDLIELHEKLKKNGGRLPSDEILLDVRTPEEFAEGHIQGSVLVPHDEVVNSAQELKKYKAVYIICRTGRRAIYAYDVLFDAGLRNLVCVATTGMLDWVDAGYPIEK